MKKPTTQMTPLETALGWCYFVFQLLILGPALILINGFLPVPMSITGLNICMFMINFLFILLIFHRFLWKNLKAALVCPMNTLKLAGVGFVLYYISSMLISLLVYAIEPTFVNANDDNISQMLQNNYFLMSLCTVFLVPVVEETLYRGLLFGCLYRKNALLGYGLSALIFSGIHIIGYIGAYEPFTLFLCFLQYLPAGIFLAWSYVSSDSLWTPIIIHIAVNQIGILAAR